MSEVILCSPLKDTMYTFETSPLSKTTQPSFHKAVALSVLEHNTCLQEILKARNPPNTICFPANEHNYNVYLRLARQNILFACFFAFSGLQSDTRGHASD